MRYKFTNRNIHRDLAYFYVGLIIAFSFSGIILNHRQSWYPMEYTYQSTPIELELPDGELSEVLLTDLVRAKGHEYQSHRSRGSNLRIDLVDGGIIEWSTETREGNLEYRIITPVVGHTMKLHKSTNEFWIWYSDLFGVAMILISITGMLIPNGNKGFGKRGWKLMLIGLVIPLLFLFIF